MQTTPSVPVPQRMVNCFRQRAAQPVQVNRSQFVSGGLGGTTTIVTGSTYHAAPSLAASRLGDDGAPYLLHVRDHASSLLELRSMAPEHVHGHTFLRLPQKSCLRCQIERMAHQTSPHRQPAWRDRVKCRDQLVLWPTLDRIQMTSGVGACS